jgi:hypothetical protein
MECTKEPGNPVFWGEIKNRKGELGLITAPEAAKHGGKSNILDSSAEEVRHCIEEKSPHSRPLVLVKLIC